MSACGQSAPALDQVAKEGGQGHHSGCLLAHGIRCRRAYRSRDVLMGPMVKLLLLSVGHAQHLRNHPDGQQQSKLSDKIHLSV